MENYSYGSYADSGDSSPRSREIEFDSVTPPPWDNPNYRAKFMCSYGGKILPRPNDNSLCYVGGETKILAVDRAIKLSTMLAKLAALFGADDVTFKYQLAGEDLDALISVTNDDDFDLMMCEHDRVYRSGARPARMRLFLFQPYGIKGGLGPDGFVEALNLGPVFPETAAAGAALASKKPNSVDYLFGLERHAAPSAPPAPHVVHAPPDAVGRVAGPGVENYTGMTPESYYAALAAAAAAAQKVVSERNSVSASGAASVPVMAGYLPERYVTSGGFPIAGVGEHPVYVIPASGAMIQPPFVPPMAPPAVNHHAAAAAYITSPALQRNAVETYKERSAYGVIPTSSLPFSTMPLKILPVSCAPPSVIAPLSSVAGPTIPPPPAAMVTNIPYSAAMAPPNILPSQAQKIAATYPEGTTAAAAAAAMARTSGGYAVATSEAVSYGQVACDNTTPRLVYYAAAGPAGGVGGMAPPAMPHSFSPVAGVGAAATRGVGLDSKVVLPKVTQGRVV